MASSLSTFLEDLRDKGAEPPKAAKGWTGTLAKSALAALAGAATVIEPIRAALDKWAYVGVITSTVVPLALVILSVRVIASKGHDRQAGFGGQASARPRYTFSAVERRVAKVGLLCSLALLATQITWNAPRREQIVEGYACRSSDKTALRRVAVDVYDGLDHPIGQAATNDDGYFRAAVPGWKLPATTLHVASCEEKIASVAYGLKAPRGCPADADDSNLDRYQEQVAWSFGCATKTVAP